MVLNKVMEYALEETLPSLEGSSRRNCILYVVVLRRKTTLLSLGSGWLVWLVLALERMTSVLRHAGTNAATSPKNIYLYIAITPDDTFSMNMFFFLFIQERERERERAAQHSTAKECEVRGAKSPKHPLA